MASPTEAEIQDQIRRVVKLYDELRLFGAFTATNNWVSMEDALQQVIETDFAPEVLAGLAGTRSRIAGALGDLGSAMLPLLREYGKFIGAPETDAASIMDRLRRNFVANVLSVNSREFVFGAPAAGGANAGNGTVLRLNVDEDGFDLEDRWAEAYTADCIDDQNTGTAIHEEVFEVRGPAARRDLLQLESGSGTLIRLSALSSRSGGLIGNPSFSLFGGSAAVPTSVTDWTSDGLATGDGSEYVMDQVNFYRSTHGETSTALRIKLTRQFSQRLDLRGTRLDPRVPYLMQLAWNREVAGATGTLTIRMGAQSVAVVAAAQLGWQLLRTPLTSAAWYKNFDEQLLDIRIEWVRTAGEVLVDDIVFAPGTRVAGGWLWIIGGSTAFLRDDRFTWTDTELASTGAKVQRALWRAGLGYLPSNKLGTETWADPA